MAEGKHQKIYEFAGFRLIPDEGLLMREDKEVRLSPKSFETLVLLVERRGHLVEKEELVKTLWEDAFVEESAVAKSVWAIRQALGEDSKSNRFIQTVPKRGYRFVADVAVIDTANGLPESTPLEEPDVEMAKRRPSDVPESVEHVEADRPLVGRAGGESADQVVAPAKSTGRRSFVVTAGLGVMALILIGGYFVWQGRRPLGTRAGNNRIAVLPSKSLDPQNRDPFYEFGIADSLILKLGSSRDLAVRQLNAVRNYAGLDVDPIETGKEQEVDYLLDSHYQLVGGRIKVTSQLFRVATGAVEDTFTVETDAADPFSAQKEIANDIGNRILGRFGAATSAFKPKRGTNNQEAYRLYQQAMYLSAQRRVDSVSKSIEMFDGALQLDPNYAQAWAGKARALWISSMTIAKADPSAVFTRAMEAIKKALALDPNLPEAYSALCGVKFSFEYDFAGAETACKRAIELGPDSAVVHQSYSMFLTTRGRFDESRAEGEKAMELDPTSYEIRRFYANGLYFAGRYDEAIARYQTLIEDEPDANATYNWLIRTLEAQGKESDAFEWFIRSLKAQKADDLTVQRYTAAYQKDGYRGVLLQRIADAEEGRSSNYLRTAGWYARVGDKDKAFECLEQAFQMHDGLIPLTRFEPQFEALRSDPRYADLVRRIEGH